MSIRYDIVFLGYGVSSLITLYKNISKFKDKKILVLEKGPEVDIGKNICGFWQESDLPMTHKWERYFFKLDGDEQAPYSHYYGKLDFEKMDHLIKENLQIDLRFNSQYVEFTNDANGFCIKTVEDIFQGTELYDSTPLQRVADSLKQNFLGHELEFEVPHEVKFPVIMDLERFDEASNDLFFYYLLPLSSTRLLIEATTYSLNNLDEECLARAINKYVECHFSKKNFSFTKSERGSLQLLKVYNRNQIDGYYPIGVRAGMMRAATGYSAAMVDLNQNYGKLWGGVLWILDRLLLKVMIVDPIDKNILFKKFTSRMGPREFASFMSPSPSLSSLLCAIKTMPKMVFVKNLFTNCKSRITYEVP